MAQNLKKDLLSEDARKATAMGLSYGQYRALLYMSAPTPPPSTPKINPPRKKTKRYTDQILFDLWKQGKTDAEIGTAVGVSRAMIQKWRDTMELPSSNTGRENYQLVYTEYGVFAVTENDLK